MKKGVLLVIAFLLLISMVFATKSFPLADSGEIKNNVAPYNVTTNVPLAQEYGLLSQPTSYGLFSIDITNCTEINESGEYALANDLVAIGGNDCIYISTSNVSLDLGGFSISESNIGSSGVYIGTSLHNITVKNGTLFNNTFGIFTDMATQGIVLSNLTVTENANGISMIGSNESSAVTYCTVSNNGGPGINVSGKGILVYGNTVRNNVNAGIISEGNESIISNNVVDSNEYGIVISSGILNLIEYNVAYNSTYEGILVNSELEGANTITMNNVSYNGLAFQDTGIAIYGSQNSVSYNVVDHNGWDGIDIWDNFCSVVFNNVSFNGDDGIWSSGDYTSFYYNVAFNNSDEGIDSEGRRSSIQNNIVYENAENGIEVEGDINQISNNIIYNNPLSGINLMSGIRSSISNNNITGNGDGSINDVTGFGGNRTLYAWPNVSVPNYTFVNISDALQTIINASNDGLYTDFGNYTIMADDQSFEYDLPFNFSYLGKNVTRISVSTNGIVELLETGESCEICSEYYNTLDEGLSWLTDSRRSSILASFGDIVTNSAPGDYLAVVNPDDNYLIIEWLGSSYHDYNSSSYPIHMQVILYANGTVDWNVDVWSVSASTLNNDAYAFITGAQFNHSARMTIATTLNHTNTTSYSADLSVPLTVTGSGEFEADSRNFIQFANSNGSIEWTNATFLDNLTILEDLVYGNNILIEYNYISFNSSAFNETLFNSSADISVYDLPMGNTNYRILRDGVACPSNTCINITPLGQTNVVFNVTGWSSYRIAWDAPSSSGNSGGSGGGSMDYYPRTYNVSSEDFKNGSAQILRKNDKITFSVDGEDHTVTLNSYTATIANVTVQSDPLLLSLSTGEEIEVDINNDGKKDALLRYDGTSGGMAKIYLRAITEEPILSTPTATSSNTSAETTPVPAEQNTNPQKASSNSGWIVFAIIVIIILAVCIAVFRHKK